MAKYGFVKVAAAVPQVKVGDCDFNTKEIESLIAQAEGKGVEIICFPELSVTGCSCGDLFQQQQLLDSSESGLFRLLDVTRSLNIIAVVGMPVRVKSVLLNCAVVINRGKIIAAVPKSFIPSHKEFAEKRWFASGLNFMNTTTSLCGQNITISTNALFHTSAVTFGIEVGEDLFATIAPSSQLALNGAEIIFNPSSVDAVIGKYERTNALITAQSAKCQCGYVSVSCGFGESTDKAVNAGDTVIYENGKLLAEGERFALKDQLVISEIDVEYLRSARMANTSFVDSVQLYNLDDSVIFNIDTDPSSESGDDFLTRSIDPTPFIPKEEQKDERCEEIFNIQINALAKRMTHTCSKCLVVGISGGLDSTLALLVCAKTMDKLQMERKNIISVTMPGFGTTDRTYNNAIALMQSLGTTIKEISIKDACIQHFKDIDHDVNVHDVVYENSQARERTQILMDIANQVNGLVVGTGDLSELALGWATYNGDHMSNYGVNASIPKTLMRHIVGWVASGNVDERSKATLLDILATPISPELIPADENGNIKQKTEDLVGPYELHDFFLFHFIRNSYRPSKIYFLARQAFRGTYDDETIMKWLKNFCRRFFTQQFKRSCMPSGPKVGSVGLNDWMMPSDASYSEWLKDLE